MKEYNYIMRTLTVFTHHQVLPWMRLAGHITHIGTVNAYKILVEKPT
jgi:hypothetical protein